MTTDNSRCDNCGLPIVSRFVDTSYSFCSRFCANEWVGATTEAKEVRLRRWKISVVNMARTIELEATHKYGYTMSVAVVLRVGTDDEWRMMVNDIEYCESLIGDHKAAWEKAWSLLSFEAERLEFDCSELSWVAHVHGGRVGEEKAVSRTVRVLENDADELPS